MISQKQALEIMDIFAKQNTTPKSELEYHNAYTLLVAIILSAQSTDKGVNKATRALFEVVDTPQAMLDLGLERLKDYVKTIGLYNNKSKNIMEMSRILVEKFSGIVPDNREDLESLPGVGRKTASVLLNVWYNQPTMAVDTHVFRIAHRLYFSEGKTPVGVENDLLKLFPEKYLINANHWLVLFGRYICKAQKPDCEKCPISNYCSCDDKRI